jgi:hypothetical protein
LRDTWNSIHADPALKRVGLPAVGRLDIPRVHKPTCPEHCNGRHEVDGVLMCPTHKTPMYKVVLHGWFHDDGHSFNSIEPMNGAPELKVTTPTCPDCGKELERRWI